jgi:glutamate-1-semialdehyde 2,1-aminomutase
MSKLLPVGAQTYSKAPDRYPEGAPETIGHASGAWVWDGRSNPWALGRVIHGKRYVDLTSGLGAVLLGHGHPVVVEAIADQLNRGISYPLPTRLEERVAERLVSMLTWERAESVRFGKNGADVTGSAVRLARAVTGKNTIVYLDYHGHHDWCMTEPPMNAGTVFTFKDERPMSWKVGRDLHELAGWVMDDDVAAVVLEGRSSTEPHYEYEPTFWPQLRDICDEHDVLLILDEMVTGFRMAAGGAAEVYGIEPDIACYGKGMANGMPLSAIVGPWDILKRYEQDVFFSTTHGGEALSLAAADATMRVIVEEAVPQQLATLGEEVLRAATGSYGYPQRVMFDYMPEQLAAMVRKGVLTQGYANLTLSHVKDTNAQDTLFKAIEAAEALA